MKRKIIFFLILSLSSVIAGFLFFREGVENILYSKIEEIEKSLPKIIQSANKKKVELPPPLKLLVEEKEPGFLTRQGIVDQTNIKRGLKGLPPLKENALLDRSAQFKAEDMLKNHYFAHQSPLAEGVGDLANKFGYQYLIIGENLAMGNFANDKELVEAWMASPGHRENILGSYKEIGIGIKKGLFEGKMVWVAVQHFGSPASLCSSPNLELKEEIEKNELLLKEIESRLRSLREEIKAVPSNVFKKDYLQKIKDYNRLVSQYNDLLKKEKEFIDQYNSQVRVFNQCIESFLP